MCAFLCSNWSSNAVRFPGDRWLDLDCTPTVCQYIHPLHRCKCPLRDNPSNEKVKAVLIITVIAFRIEPRNTCGETKKPAVCMIIDEKLCFFLWNQNMVLCAFVFFSRVQQMLFGWTWLGRDRRLDVCHSLPRNGDKAHRFKLSSSFCLHRYVVSACKWLHSPMIVFFTCTSETPV